MTQWAIRRARAVRLYNDAINRSDYKAAGHYAILLNTAYRKAGNVYSLTFNPTEN